MGCNCEFFTMPGFLEVESLGPLVKLHPNEATEHIEKWRVISQRRAAQRRKTIDCGLKFSFERFRFTDDKSLREICLKFAWHKLL